MLDASAFIHLWDMYPRAQFPRLWAWLEGAAGTQAIVAPAPAFEEVTHMAPECARFLRAAGLRRLPVTAAVVARAVEIKGLIGVVNDRFHPKGVDENDVLIIATARCADLDLVTHEGRQTLLPVDMKKYKIPAVCGLTQVNTNCLSVIEFIRSSGRIFG